MDRKQRAGESLQYPYWIVRWFRCFRTGFCLANNVYCVCLTRSEGVLTKAYGSKKELDYLHQKMGMGLHIALLKRLTENDIEEVIEQELEEDYLKMCALAIKIGGETVAIWVVLAVLDEPGIHGEDVPPYIKTTTTERFYSSISFLESLTKQYFCCQVRRSDRTGSIYQEP